MIKKTKIFIPVLIIEIMLGFGLVEASGGELVLEALNSCSIKSAGNSCVADLKIMNDTDKELDGEMFLNIKYQGICGSGLFDGEGINAEFSAGDGDWLDFLGWNNGTTVASGFNIGNNESRAKIKIKTVSNLCPGLYIFDLALKGEGYISAPIRIGMSGDDNSEPEESTEKKIADSDINGDGVVGIFEFTSLMADWNKTGSGIPTDFNKDGKVDVLDFAILMANWTE
jgi:hypothetical protein